MSSFLDSLAFLSPAERAALHALDIDDPETVLAMSASEIETATTKVGTPLTPGKCAKILATARKVGPSAAAEDEVARGVGDKITRITLGLQALAIENPSHLTPRKRQLDALGVEYAVLDADGKVAPIASLELYQHLDTGVPKPPTWKNQRVVPLADIGAPQALCNPRTGKPLQAGADELSGVKWADLGMDGLRVTAYGYNHADAFPGSTEEAVFAAMSPGTATRTLLEQRMKNLGVAPELLDYFIVWSGHRRGNIDGPRTPAPATPQSSGRPSLTRLFLAMFSVDEMRRFISYLPGGDELTRSLPGGGVSPATYAHEAEQVIVRKGYFTRDLRDRLVAERPRRSDEIDRVFANVL